MHPRERLAEKIKNLTDDNDVEFIKHVHLHQRERLKRLTGDMYRDMEIVNWNNDINVDNISDAKTIIYMTNSQPKQQRKKYSAAASWTN